MPVSKPSRRDLLRWFAYGAATAAVPAVYGDVSTGWVQWERRTLKVPRWGQNGFRIAFLSDFHAMDDRRVDIGERAIQMALEEKPDAILLGGDYLNTANRRQLKLLARLVSGLVKAKCPVIGVFGNHDFWSEDLAAIAGVLAASPVKILRNEALTMGGVVIGGVDDGIAKKQQPEFLREFEGQDSVLALYHEPDFVHELPSSVSLTLSGHSHGGQICLPGGLPIHLPYGARKYVAGFYPEAHVPLYVSRGVGTIGPDFRLFCRPEVGILTIEKA
jgi:predicted MPP superfamily phosphohydrolase